jgi:NADH-quinone oxidoreductase subunit A
VRAPLHERTNKAVAVKVQVLVSGLYPGLLAYRRTRSSRSDFPTVPRGYFGQYVTIGIFAVVGMVLVYGTLGLARLMRPNLPNHEKFTTYESGIDPIGAGWSQSNVRYYVFALLFVVFDVEAVFLFPWAIVFERLGTQAFVEMIIFIGILALALLYAIKKKVLEWQ